MISAARKLLVLAFGLSLVTAGAIAQEPKEGPNDVPSAGQAPDAVVGPDAFGYVIYDNNEPECTFEYVDITATGAQVAMGDDVSSGPVALLGPAFNLYGSNYTSLVAATNGYISTDPGDSGPDLSNDCPLPAAPSTGGGARIYPLHDDLIATILFEYFASCPRPSRAVGGIGEGCYVFQWNNTTHFGGGGPFGFQVILYDTTWAMAFQHLAGNPETGSGSTTGLQNLGATVGLTYACNSGSSVAASSAQCVFHPSAPPAFAVEGAAGFEVNKTFNDGNEGYVEVTLTCNTGLPLEQHDVIAEGDNVTFVVRDFEDGQMDCEVTETGGLDGYTASYDDGTVSSVSCVYEDVVLQSRNVCDISNSLDLVDVDVTKEWIDENPQFAAINIAEASWSCSNVAFGPWYGYLDFFGDDDTQTFSIYPDWEDGTTCSVTEVSLPDSGIETDDSDCQGLELFPGGAAACTIVNTRLYEGIPTLSQYGLAVLALMMLGMGFVAYRRIV